MELYDQTAIKNLAKESKVIFTQVLTAMSFKRNKTVKSYDEEFKKNAIKLVIVEKMNVLEVTTKKAWACLKRRFMLGLACLKSKNPLPTNG